MFKFFKRGKIPQQNVTEKPDPQPHAASIKFKRPLSLNEQVAHILARRLQPQSPHEEDPLDAPFEDDTEFVSEHELFEDPRVGKELTRAESRFIDLQEKAFDEEIKRRRQIARKRSRSVKEASGAGDNYKPQAESGSLPVSKAGSPA